MRAIDFRYDGKRLSNYGMIVCRIDATSGVDVIDAGAKIEFSTAARKGGRKFSMVGTSYSEGVSAEFDIAKDPCKYDDLEISDREYNDIIRWLSREEFCEMYFIDDEKFTERRYYNGVFNIAKVMVGDKLCGLRLTMTADKPYAHGRRKCFEFDFDSEKNSGYLYDSSNTVVSIIPDIKITCMEAGDLELSNELFDCTMKVDNCSEGEVIIVNGETMQISSTDLSHKIWDDFNYEFLEIGNTPGSRNNRISANLECNVEITYCPIIKDAP